MQPKHSQPKITDNKLLGILWWAKVLCANAVQGMAVVQVAYNAGLEDGLYLEIRRLGER